MPTTTLDKSTYAPFVEADATADAATLRAMVEEYGYLFFRGLIPAEVVLQARRDVLELCQEAGWIDPAHDLMDAYAMPGYPPSMEGRPDYMAVYRKILRTPSFHDFPTEPALLNVAHKLLGVPLDEVFVHPRRIGRVTFPHLLSATTPPHQDHYYIRGAVDTYSCWTPIGECPIALGGLAVAPRSHRGGFLDHNVRFEGAVGGAGVHVEEEREWHISDYGLGDALFFTSYTIHKAMPNLTDDRLRLSTDNRYQRPKEAITPDALRPHLGAAKRDG